MSKQIFETSNCWSTTVVYCILNSILTDKLVILFALIPPAPLPPQQLFFTLLCPALDSLSSIPELPCFQLYEGFSQCEALKRSEHRRERSLTIFSPRSHAYPCSGSRIGCFPRLSDFLSGPHQYSWTLLSASSPEVWSLLYPFHKGWRGPPAVVSFLGASSAFLHLLILLLLYNGSPPLIICS